MATMGRLNYQKLVPGKRVGRYIGVEDLGELADEHEAHVVSITDARGLVPQASLENFGFELCSAPSSADFSCDSDLRSRYYAEIEELVAKVTGAYRVFVFDHTFRDTSATGLNSSVTGTAAAAVARVHCDYSEQSAPKRVKTLVEAARHTGAGLSKKDADAILLGDFAFINIWRNIASEPVQRLPLAVLDPACVGEEEWIPYEMQYPDRKGENYAMRFNPKHRWYFYPHMTKEECLMFKVYDSRKGERRPRFVFHTAFEDLETPLDAPARRSLEVRTIACFRKRRMACLYDFKFSWDSIRHSRFLPSSLMTIGVFTMASLFCFTLRTSTMRKRLGA